MRTDDGGDLHQEEETALPPLSILPREGRNAPEDYQQVVTKQIRDLFAVFVTAASIIYQASLYVAEQQKDEAKSPVRTPGAEQDSESKESEEETEIGGIKPDEAADLMRAFTSTTVPVVSAPTCGFEKAKRASGSSTLNLHVN